LGEESSAKIKLRLGLNLKNYKAYARVRFRAEPLSQYDIGEGLSCAGNLLNWKPHSYQDSIQSSLHSFTFPKINQISFLPSDLRLFGFKLNVSSSIDTREIADIPIVASSALATVESRVPS
jgi:hypothetical protein